MSSFVPRFSPPYNPLPAQQNLFTWGKVNRCVPWHHSYMHVLIINTHSSQHTWWRLPVPYLPHSSRLLICHIHNSLAERDQRTAVSLHQPLTKQALPSEFKLRVFIWGCPQSYSIGWFQLHILVRCPIYGITHSCLLILLWEFCLHKGFQDMQSNNCIRCCIVDLVKVQGSHIIY